MFTLMLPTTSAVQQQAADISHKDRAKKSPARKSLFFEKPPEFVAQPQAGPGVENASPAAACRTGRTSDESGVVGDAECGRLRRSRGNDHSSFATE